MVIKMKKIPWWQWIQLIKRPLVIVWSYKVLTQVETVEVVLFDEVGDMAHKVSSFGWISHLETIYFRALIIDDFTLLVMPWCIVAFSMWILVQWNISNAMENLLKWINFFNLRKWLMLLPIRRQKSSLFRKFGPWSTVIHNRKISILASESY